MKSLTQNINKLFVLDKSTNNTGILTLKASCGESGPLLTFLGCQAPETASEILQTYISVSVGNLSWQHRGHPWAGGKRLSHFRSPPELLSPQWRLTRTRDLGFPVPHWDGSQWSSSCDCCSPLSLLLGWRPVKTNKPLSGCILNLVFIKSLLIWSYLVSAVESKLAVRMFCKKKKEKKWLSICFPPNF